MSGQALWTAYEAAAATGGALGAQGPAARWDAPRLPEEDWIATGLSIDTRTLSPGDIFVAVADARDGHDFVGQAFERGAAAALVARAPEGVPADKPLLIVPEARGGTMAGLHAMAAAARDRCFGQLVAVTGSAGKTSTKEMLRAALGRAGTVHAAEASFNNHLGVPLTLAALPADADYGVFEIGMNHAGEITPLAGLVRPHVAIVTTVAAAHLEFFDSVQAIAHAKAEIISGLRPGGACVLPADNEHFGILKREADQRGVRVVQFGETAQGADAVRLTAYEAGTDGRGGTVRCEVGGKPVRFALSVPGRHQAMNALAVIAACAQAGAPLVKAVEGLEAFRPGAGRGARHEVELNGARVILIDESYNANPASMRAALDVLAAERPRGHGRRIAVIGDMRELGADSRALHAGLAEHVRADRVLTAGDDARALAGALPDAVRGPHADAALDLAGELLDDLREGDVILFKGSNASRVGALVEALLERADARPGAGGAA